MAAREFRRLPETAVHGVEHAGELRFGGFEDVEPRHPVRSGRDVGPQRDNQRICRSRDLIALVVERIRDRPGEPRQTGPSSSVLRGPVRVLNQKILSTNTV